MKNNILQPTVTKSLISSVAETMTGSTNVQTVNENSVAKMVAYLDENGKNFGTHDHSDFKALIQEKVDPVAAREFLNQHKIPRDKSFFDLNSDQVNAIVDHGKKNGYKKKANAPASYGRMYHAHLCSLASKADEMKAEKNKKYNIKEEIQNITEGTKSTMEISFKGVSDSLIASVRDVMVESKEKKTEDLNEAQGSYTRTEPMRKSNRDSWKPNPKKPRKDFDRTKRTVKEPVDVDEEAKLEEAQGSFARVSPMRKGDRDDYKRNSKKPLRNFDRSKRTVKEPVDESVEYLDELSKDTLTSYQKKARGEVDSYDAKLKTLASKRGRKSAADLSAKAALEAPRAKREAGARAAGKRLSAIHQKAWDAIDATNKQSFNEAIPKVLNKHGFQHVHSTDKTSLYMHHDPETNTITTVKHIHSPDHGRSPEVLLADSGRATSSHQLPWASHFKKELPNHEEEFEKNLKSYMGNKSWHSHGHVYEGFEADDDDIMYFGDVEDLDEATINDFEELVELSKKTLGRYIGLASIQKSGAAEAIGHENGVGSEGGQPDRAYQDKANKLHAKRSGGIGRATQKLVGSDPWVKEEVENLDELSKKTLGSYVKKAAGSLGDAAFEDGESPYKTKEYAEKYHTYPKNARKVSLKREKGIGTAVKKLTKEEVENLDELSKATLGSYVKKANDDSNTHSRFYGRWREKEDGVKVDKRVKGIGTAIKKLTKEDVDLEEARGRPRKNPNPEGEEGSEANQNIINQIRKAADSGLKPVHVRYENGESHPVTRSQARAVMNKFMKLKPTEKLEMQNHIAKSHSNLMSHI